MSEPELELLEELLLRWEAARQQGEPMPLEVLCAASPQCIDAVRQRIRVIEEMEDVLGVRHSDVTVTSDRHSSGKAHDAELPHIPGYEIVRMIDEGGMGIVYEARQVALGRTVALKMVGGLRLSAKQIARFRTEAESAARLHHPNIVPIFEVGQVNGRPFFSMELIDGGSLAKAVANGVWRKADRETPAKAAQLVATIADAVHCAHERGVVHRDLKPANVLLTAAGVPKIADFGLAKRLDEDSGHTESGEVLGTPNYMAPEQAEGRKDQIGPATDVYALGIILYELLTGKLPFRAATTLETLRLVTTQDPAPPSSLALSPRDLDAICLKCLEKKPAQRYHSALDLADDLRRFLDGRPVRARRLGAVGRSWKWIKRHPQWTAGLGTAALLAGVTLLFAVRHLLAEQQIRARAEQVAPQVREILQRNCFECHGQDPAHIEKKLNILDHATLLDTRRRIVVPGSPADSRLIQRIADGSMPPEEEETRLPRLAELELAILRDWINGGAPPLPPTAPGQIVVPYSETAAQAKQVFEKHCYRCHKYDVARGGIKILHHRLLLTVRKVVLPGRPEESELFHLLTANDEELRMPPPPSERLPREDIETIRQWILEGAPPFPKGP